VSTSTHVRPHSRHHDGPRLAPQALAPLRASGRENEEEPSDRKPSLQMWRRDPEAEEAEVFAEAELAKKLRSEGKQARKPRVAFAEDESVGSANEAAAAEGGENPAQEEHAGEEEAEEAVAPRVLKDPGQPTPEEVEEHNAIYVPFRSWCVDCVRGRKKNPGRYRQKNADKGSVPSVHLDYCFLRDGDEELLTVIAVRDKITGTTFAAAVGNKGSADDNAVGQVADFVTRLGHSKATKSLRLLTSAVPWGGGLIAKPYRSTAP
jgi:hypothetical protein